MLRLAIPLLTLSALIAAPALAGSFPWTNTYAEVGNVGGGKTCDDVIPNPFDTNLCYATKTGNTTEQRIYSFTLTRADGKITGGFENWNSDSTLIHNNMGLKTLDMYNADTLFYTLEEGGGDTDGLIGRLTGVNGGALLHAEAADLTGVRSGGSAEYDPEGIAIDRANHFLYVMTDDAPNADVTQYAINPTTLALTKNWVASAGGTDNGNDGIVLSDGRVAFVSGSAVVNIYAASQDGKSVVNLLKGGVSGGTVPQALLEFDGYLYLFWEDGLVQAFDAADLANMKSTPAGTWNLSSVFGTVAIGGASVTAEGHLLVSTRGGVGDASVQSRVFAFNSTGRVPPRQLSGPVLQVK